MMSRSYPANPAATRLAAVHEPRACSSLPVTRKTLKPSPLSVWNSCTIAGIPGHIPLLAHILNATGSYALINCKISFAYVCPNNYERVQDRT